MSASLMVIINGAYIKVKEAPIMNKLTKQRKISVLIGLAVALGIGGGAYAFTASNTVPATIAGTGVGVVSGYTVTNIHYALNSTTPANIDSLTFTLSPAIPSTSSGKVIIAAALSVGGPTNYTCTTDVAGTTATCATTTPQLTSTLLTGITVVAAQ
jgi:hypothetical protein